MGNPDSPRDVRQSESMPLLIGDAEATDIEDLQGIFWRASHSNENDRGLSPTISEIPHSRSLKFHSQAR